jgi:hypothetical protein
MSDADDSSDDDLCMDTDELQEEGVGGVEEERKESGIADVEQQQQSDGCSATIVGAGPASVPIPVSPSPWQTWLCIAMCTVAPSALQWEIGSTTIQ